MADRVERVCIGLFALCLLGLWSGYVFRLGKDSVRKEALLTGHAVFSTDATGNPKFEWIVHKKEKSDAE